MLQALYKYSNTLQNQGKIQGDNWAKQKVYAGLHLNTDGSLIEIIPLGIKQKSRLIPAEILVPRTPERTVNIASGFLCDNSKYFLGIEKKESSKTKQAFEAARDLHLALLENCQSEAGKAIRSFFESWDPGNAENCQPILDNRKLIENGNLVFFVNDLPAHDDPELRQIWEDFRNRENEAKGDDKQICLVTGEPGLIAGTHPKIKGVPGTTSSGAALVSFNFEAAKSYGKEQNYNSPVSEAAANAYVKAVNYLLSSPEHHIYLGNESDLTAIFWTDSNDDQYLDILNALFGSADKVSAEESDAIIKGFLTNLISGKPVDYEAVKLNENEPFHILVLSGNSGRICVHSFLNSTFGRVLEDLSAHFSRIQMVKPSYEKSSAVSMYRLLLSSVNQAESKGLFRSGLVSRFLESIINDTNYPDDLFQNILHRIQIFSKEQKSAEWTWASFIRAYLIKNKNEKETPMALDMNSDSQAYNLGRLFAVLEWLQEESAGGKPNTTIRDRYFASASSSPASVFPVLLRLAGNHFSSAALKEKKGRAVFFDKQIGEIMDKLGSSLPPTLSTADQGSFYLGYYQQKQKRYERKDKDNEQKGKEPENA